MASLAFLPRFCRHIWMNRWIAHRILPKTALARIEQAVKKSEQFHRGEICFAVESELDTFELIRGITPRARAQQVFVQLNVWNTEENSGVLIYILLADRAVEIVADRGIAKLIDQSHWQAIADEMSAHLKLHEFEVGCVRAIERATELLSLHFPAHGSTKNSQDDNELPNKPFRL